MCWARRVLAAAGFGAIVGARVTAAAAGGLEVTVYAHDLGFVQEPREVELAGRRDTVRIEEVPEALDFSSLRVTPGSGARLARLAWRWDAVSGGALIERTRGSRVRVAARDGRASEGVLLAADGEWLVLRGDDGTVCVLARDAVEEMRLATVAQPLALRPAVEAVLEGERPGRVRLELSYLTGGLSWSAEHTLVRRSETTAAWSATVQVRNSTGRDFVDADLRLVAGEPQRGGRGPAPRAVAMMAARAEDAVAEKSVLQEEGFAEYHLYRLPQPATLRDREVQSLVMLEARDVRVAPRYLYRDGDAQGVRAQLELRNERAAGLGVPLPGGRVRVYEPDAAGALQFAGETTIRHTAVDESLTLDVGRAFDLAAERRVTADRRLSDRERERSVEIELRNHKGAAVTVLVEESVPADTEVLRSTVPVVRKDAGTLSFEVPVPAGERAVLSYAARLRW